MNADPVTKGQSQKQKKDKKIKVRGAENPEREEWRHGENSGVREGKECRERSLEE